MPTLRILSKCAARGQHLAQSSVLTVPDELDAEAASQLVRMHRAAWIDPATPESGPAPAPATPAKRRKKAD